LTPLMKSSTPKLKDGSSYANWEDAYNDIRQKAILSAQSALIAYAKGIRTTEFVAATNPKSDHTTNRNRRNGRNNRNNRNDT